MQFMHKAVVCIDAIVSAFPTFGWGQLHQNIAGASMRATAESLGVTREGSQTPGSGDNYKTHVHLPLWHRHGGREGVEAESHRAQEEWRGGLCRVSHAL